jgi:hypothetical protein
MSTTRTPAMRHVSPHLGWRGTLAAAWTLAGGIAGGGFVTALLLAGALHPETALLITTIFALLGSMLGGIHGAVIGHIGHPDVEDMNTTWADRVFTVAVAVGAAVLALLTAAWLAMAAVLARNGSIAGWAALMIGAAAASAALLWATVLGWHALENAYARWPRRRLGVMLVAGAFVFTAGALLLTGPLVPDAQLHIRFIATLAIAALTTIWVATPAVILALRFTRAADPARSHADVSTGLS